MKKLFIILAITGISQLTIAGDAISVIKLGSGKPVIFLPGFSCPGEVWENTVKQIGDGYQSHIVTYAGFGMVKPVDTPWYATVTQAIISYIQKENLNNIIVVGHSMGGNLAIEIAATLPRRCEKVVLVDAIPCVREIMMPGVSAAQISYNNPYAKQMLNMPDTTFRLNAEQMAAGMCLDTAGAAKITKWMIEADRKTYTLGYIDLLKLDLRNELSLITAEVLILGAPFPDALQVKTNFEKQYEKLKQKQIFIAPHGRHFIMFDQPEWFYKQVSDFLLK